MIFKPVRMAVDEDDEGLLAFCEDRLVAVLVRLSDLHDDAGRWFLETGFGRLEGPSHPSFKDLEAAEAWIRARLQTEPDRRGNGPRLVR